MKESTVLLVDRDGDCEEPVASAAARAGYRLRWLRTSSDVFKLTTGELQSFAVIIVDVDPGAHGLALLEAISGCGERPPMMVLTGLEQSYMEPIAVRHGALACVGKPISIDKLRLLIEELSADSHVTSDLWGHPTPSNASDGGKIAAAKRGIAAKLSATATPADRKRPAPLSNRNDVK